MGTNASVHESQPTLSEFEVSNFLLDTIASSPGFGNVEAESRYQKAQLIIQIMATRGFCPITAKEYMRMFNNTNSEPIFIWKKYSLQHVVENQSDVNDEKKFDKSILVISPEQHFSKEQYVYHTPIHTSTYVTPSEPPALGVHDHTELINNIDMNNIPQVVTFHNITTSSNEISDTKRQRV